MLKGKRGLRVVECALVACVLVDIWWLWSSWGVNPELASFVAAHLCFSAPATLAVTWYFERGMWR